NPESTWTRNYLGVTEPTSEEARAALKQAAGGAAELLIYNGHGNSVRLGAMNPRIVDTGSVQEWTGTSVFIQNACTVNWVAKNENGWRSIAMQALSQPQGGISASIGATTYTQPEPCAQFTIQLLRQAQPSGVRWGDCLLRTQQWA